MPNDDIFDAELNSPQPYVPKETPKLDNYLKNPTIMVSEIDDVLKESLYDPALPYKIAQAKADSPKMRYEDFCNALGIPEEERRNSYNWGDRESVTRRANINYIKAAQNARLAQPEAAFKLQPSDRQFKAIMCGGGYSNREKNEKTCKLFEKLFNKTANREQKLRMVKAIETRFNEFLENEKWIDQSYTDEELVENWEYLHETIKGPGMELKSFLEAIDKTDLKINPQLRQKVEAFQKKADAFNMQYHNRMSYIASPAYQYGGEEYIKQDFTKLMTTGDPEMIALGNMCEIDRTSKLTSIGLTAIADKCKNTREILGVYGANHEELGTSAGDIGKALQDGKEILIVYKDNREPVRMSMDTSSTFPPKIEEKPITLADKVESSMTKMNDAFEKLEKNDTLSPAMKNLEEDILMDQMKLSAIANNMDAPGNKKEYMKTMATLMARLSIREQCKEHPDDELIAQFADKENVKRVATRLVDEGVVKCAAKAIPEDGVAIMGMDQKELFSKFAAASKEAEKLQNAPEIETPSLQQDQMQKKQSQRGLGM